MNRYNNIQYWQGLQRSDDIIETEENLSLFTSERREGELKEGRERQCQVSQR